LQSAVRIAEPQVVGLTPQTTNERRTDTMNTYLLRNVSKVQPRPQCPTATTASQVLGRPVPRPSGPALFIGLDVHTDSIAVSLAPSDSIEVRRYGLIGGGHDDVLRLAKKLQAAHPQRPLRFCYEAGPHGYPLCRCLSAHGHDCILVAPSKMPRKPGERVKTNRRDADQLARLHRAGELAAIYVPEPQDEAVRDLIRARYQVQRQQHRARQQLKMFLLRHNLRYAGSKPWTPKHLRYLASVKMPYPEQQYVFQEMVNVISEATDRLGRYQAQIERVIPGWRWEPVVRALMGMRGLALLNAATLVAELGDLHRFATARQLMGYLGLVPSEASTGTDRQQGGITKMGNGIARRALIEAAWNYRLPARVSRQLQVRQEGLSKEITDLSWRAQTRLHHRFQHLTGVRHKLSPVAAAALGRELSGFVWALGQIVSPHPPRP
jgi:transposase